MVSGCYPFLYREDEADFFKKAEAYKRDHSAGTFLKTITLCCVAPCMADEKKIRLIAYFDRDITKADDIIDAWRVLDDVRLLINRIYENRPNIKPSYEEKVKVTALQIYGWLPKSNCRACGEATCLAFAVKLLRGEQQLSHCAPLSEEPKFIENSKIMQEMAEALGVA